MTQHGKNILSKFSLILLVLLATLALFSCSELFPPAAGPGDLTINVVTGSKTIQPDDLSATLPTAYSISGTGPAGDTFDSGQLSETSYSKTGLAAGDWSLTINGLNANGHVVAQATLAAKVVSNQTTSASATLSREAGDGTLDLSIAWSMAKEFDEVTGTITPVGGSAQTISLTVNNSGSGASFVGLKPAGDYTLNLSLQKNGTSYDSVIEAVRIFKDATSSAKLNRSASTYEYSYSSATPVIPVTFDQLAARTVKISGANGKSVYLVKINADDSGAESSRTGTAASVFESQPYSADRSLPQPVSSALDKPVQRRPHAVAENWNAHPPLAAPASGEGPLSQRNLSAPERMVDYGANPALTAGSSTKTFWVENQYGTWVQISATLYAIGQYCYVWLPTGYFNSGSTANNDNKLTQTQINALVSKFDGSAAASYQDGIYKLVTNLFGYEVGGGSAGDGGRDGDRHVSILLYDIDYDYVVSQTGGTYGFYWSKDDLTQAWLTANGYTSPKSNEAEIFYLDVHLLDRTPGSMYSTLAHEFQHMIHYNQKAYVTPALDSSGASTYSSAWANEMCSMVTEDLLVNKLGLAGIDAPYSRLEEFSYHYAESGVVDWLASPNTLKSYASVYAFGGYLLRNYGGAALFSSIVKSSKVNKAAISAALVANGYPDDTFDTSLARYGEALVFTDLPTGSSVQTFKKAGSWTVNGIVYDANSIDLATVNQYNMSSGYVAGSFGPRVFDLNSAVDLAPAGQLIQSSPSWKNLSADLSITLIKPKSDKVSLYLMVK